MTPFNLTPSDTIDTYQSEDLHSNTDEYLYVRIGTDFDHPDDALYIPLERSTENLSLQQIISEVFPRSESAREERKQDLEVEDFPELPSIYDHFARAIDTERKGEVVLDWSINLGPYRVSLQDTVKDHLSLSYYEPDEEEFPVLHLIMQEYVAPFREYEDQSEVEMDKQMTQGLFMHYMVANGVVDTITSDQYIGAVKTALDYCTQENILTVQKNSESDTYQLETTNQSDKFINQLEGEYDYYVEQYEELSDVLIEEEHVEFDTGEGDDLRLVIARLENHNPYRMQAVYNLFTGKYQEGIDNWETELRSDKFFARYLGAAAASADTGYTEEELETVHSIIREE